MAKLRSILLLAAVYFVTAKAGLHLAVVHPYATAVWPPSGLALAALLLYGRSIWPGVCLGAFLANLTNGATIDFASVGVAAGIAAGNTLEALVGCWLVERFAGGLGAFDRARGVFRFSVLAAGTSTLVSAGIGVGCLILAGLAQPRDAGAVLFTWWIGDATGDLIFAPLLILCRREALARWTRAHTAEMVAAAATALVLATVSFTNLIAVHPPGLGFAFLCTPALLWPAFRLGLAETAATLLLVNGVAIWAWLSGMMTGDLSPKFVPVGCRGTSGSPRSCFSRLPRRRRTPRGRSGNCGL